MGKIRVVIADDQVLFVRSLSRVIASRAKDIDVVAVTYDGKAAIEIIDLKRPDIALIDIKMPILDGVETTRIVHERHPDVKIMILTTYDDEEYVFNALRNGASGYLLKDIPPDEMIMSIRALSGGPAQISPLIVQKLLREDLHTSVDGEDPTSKSTPIWYRNLKPVERKLLVLVSRGYINKEIAQRLFMAEQTVKNHLTVIYGKLGIHTRVEAARLFADALGYSATDFPPKDRPDDMAK